MKGTLAGLATTLLLGIASTPAVAQSSQPTARRLPMFQVDPAWPKLPEKWVLGEVTSIAIDAQDHAWMIHRPRTIYPFQKGRAAPAVLEFDANGNFVRGWGGPGEGYQWPESEHGIYVDHKGFVWVTGNVGPDDQVLKFTKEGKFVLQIGQSGKSTGNKDQNNLHRPADVAVYPKTNEVFVADGYGNRRVAVFDADTGAFKRMWSAYGNVPTDPPASKPGAPAAEDLQQFRNVHGIGISNDGLVYVSDRGNMRFQVFTIEGKFVTEMFVRPTSAERHLTTRGAEVAFGKPVHELYQRVVTTHSSVGRTAFSPDPQQQFLYVADRSRQQIIVFDRKTLEILGTYGQAGQGPGEFFLLHHIAVDSKGNLYTAECDDDPPYGNRRVQKLVLNGLPVPQVTSQSPVPAVVAQDGTKQIIDNQRVTISEVAWTKGGLHTRRYDDDTLMVPLTTTSLRVTTTDGQSKVLNLKPGEAVLWPKGTAHTEESLGVGRAIITRLKVHAGPSYKNTSGHGPAFPRPRVKKLIENDRIAVWDYTWVAGEPTPTHFHDKDLVIVYLADGAIRSVTPTGDVTQNEFKFAEARFNPGNRTHFEEYVRGDGPRAIITELK